MELKEIPFKIEYSEKKTLFFQNKIDDLPSSLPGKYINLLRKYNGGNTYDNFFHFFGLWGPTQHNIIEWNRSELWKTFFHLDDNCFVFSEDIFGGQYFFKTGHRKNAIYMLAPDDGKTHFMADNFENFCEDIVFDSDDIYSEEKKLANDFFAITKNKFRYMNHMSYKIPIILGGDPQDINNLDQCDSLVNLSILGQLLQELKNVKPGTVIKDVKIDYINKKIHLII